MYHRLLDRRPPGTPTTLNVPGSGSASTDVLTDRRMIQVKIDLEECKPVGKALVRESGSEKWTEVISLEEEVERFVKAIHMQQMAKLMNNSMTSQSATSSSTSNQPKYSSSKPSLSEAKTTPTEGAAEQPPASRLDLSLIDAITTHIRDGSTYMSLVQDMLDISLTIFFTDTGGQPEMQEVLPALVAGPTIFMLAFDLHQPLDQLYQIRYESSISEVVQYESCCTVLEVLMQTLSSIQSFHEAQSKSCNQLHLEAESDSKFTPPPVNVLAIGTHRDLVNESQIAKVDECLQGNVAETALNQKGMIEYYTSDKLVIPIDNFSEEDGPKVRKVIDRVVKREGEGGVSPFKIELPASWLGLELYLRQQASSVVSYTECSILAEKLGISGRQLVSCLWFLHHRMGTIRYYGNSVEELKDIVITQPSILFKAVTELITSTFTLENVTREIHSKFYTWGLFKMRDVEHIFNKHKDVLQIGFEQFIGLLSHLNILGPAHNEEFDYFLPCALAHVPLPADNQSSEERDPLLVRFSTGFTPKGVTSGVLARLCKNEDWEIECDQKRSPLLFRDQASFIAHDCSVTMKAKAEHLEFILDDKRINGSVCNKFCTIRSDLEVAISDVLDKLSYTSTFQFGFYCSLEGCNSNKHFAEVDKLKAKCSITRRSVPLEERRILWFKAIEDIYCMLVFHVAFLLNYYSSNNSLISVLK